MPAETSQTLDRGLRVLELLSDTPEGLTVTEIANALRVSRTVVYRLVVTLEQHGLLRRGTDGRARIGLGILSLGRLVQPSLREAAGPALRRLADAVGATAHLTIVDGGDALAIVVVEPSRSELHVAYRVGTRHALDRGAAGRAILAGRANGGRPFDPGWIASTGELQQGAWGVAAPVLGVAGVEASVGVVALAELDVQDAGAKTVRAAGEVARVLR